jgi:type II secretory pathway component GspD/PulD (secretin)
MFRSCYILVVVCAVALGPTSLQAADERLEAIQKAIDELRGQLAKWQELIRDELQPRTEPAEKKDVPRRPDTPDRPKERPREGQRPASDAQRQRQLVRLRHAPATDVANTVAELLRSERSQESMQTVIVADVISNSLIISAPPTALDTTVQLVEALDLKPASLVIQLLLAEVTPPLDARSVPGWPTIQKRLQEAPSGEAGSGDPLGILPRGAAEKLMQHLASSPHARILAESQMVTMSNQAAFLKVEEQVPFPTRRERSGQAATIEYRDVGLVLGVTARVGPDSHIAMEIDVEHSSIVPESIESNQGGETSGQVLGAPRVRAATAQSTVAASSGQTIVLAGLAKRSGDDDSLLVVIVTPTVIP